MLAFISALVAGLSDVGAGALALREERLRLESRYVIAFGAGILLAATFFEILPEVDFKTEASWVGAGFVTFYLLEKIVMLHACGEDECEAHHIGPSAVLGMALDNVVDGVSIAVGYLIQPFLGLAITLAVVMHEIPQGLTSALIMREANWSRARILLVLGGAGALYPIGVLLAGLLPQSFLHLALAFIAGDFLYIGASDLLPEAHRRFNSAVIGCVLAGMAFMLVLHALVPTA